MKPKYILFGLLALMAASCTNDDLNEVAEMKQNGIQVTAGLTANTRVNFEQDGNVTHAYWEEGDQITLYAPSQGCFNYQVSNLGEGGYSATFAATDNALQNTDETIYAAYPALHISDEMAVLEGTYYWPDEKPMPFAYAIGKVADEKLNLSFNHVYAYIKLTLNAETVAASNIKEITDLWITNPSGTPIALAAGRFDFSSQSIVEEKGIDYLSYKLKEPFIATGTAEKSIYIPILPQPAGETIHLSVLHTTQAGVDTLFTMSKEVPSTGFVAGRAYTYSPKSSITRVGNTVTLTEAGTLSQAISAAEKDTITSLKIIGPLNGDDIRLIREMAGRDVEGNETEGQLTDLDISGATIVEGGGAYYIINPGEGYGLTIYCTINNIIGSYMFESTILEHILLPSNVCEIFVHSFHGCSSLTTISIPDSVISIGISAFEDCILLKELSITPQSALTLIESSAFYNCSSLTNIIIPDGVTQIGSSAFNGCTLLKDVSISPQSALTIIYGSAFNNCSSLTNITIPDGVNRILYSTFSGCTSLTSIDIPNGVTSISEAAFKGCTLLEEVSISPQSTLSSIGSSAFFGCSSLTDITIPDGVTEIEYGTFAYCSSLTSINIPADITEISKNAFYGCSSLSEVTCNATNPPTLDLSAFEGITSPSTLYVPSGTYIDYILSDWAQCFTTIDDGEEHEYVELLVNGDAEGEDFSCFVSREARGGLITSRVTEAGMGADGVGRAYVVASDDMVEAAWDTQFFVVSTEALNEGDIISFSMKYKADKEASTVSMWYENPELYLHWDAVGNPYFETEWQEYNTFSVINSGADGCKSIGFILNEFEEANTYYFDDISLKVLKR